MTARTLRAWQCIPKGLAAGLFSACAAFLALSPVASAQKTAPVTGATLQAMSELNFDYLSMKDTLPHNSIYAVEQDKTGFIWIATYGGLSRYSGFYVRTYTRSSDKRGSLPDNNVRTLLAREDGGLWIGTGSAGMVIYDAATDDFVTPENTPLLLRQSHIYSMASDGDGGVWFSSQYGLARYTRDQKFELYGKVAQSQNQAGFPDGAIFSVLVDRQKNLWVGAETGLYLRKAGTSQFTFVPGMTGQGEIGERAPIWSIFQDHAGKIWIGTDLTGIGAVDLATLRIHGVPGMAGPSSAIGAHTVRGMIESSPGQLWVATYGGGLFHIDTGHGNALQHWTKDPTVAQPLSNNFLRDIFQDRSGEIWLATDNGVSRFNGNALGIFDIHTSPLRPDRLFGDEVRSVAAGFGRVAVGFDQGGFAILEGDGSIHRVRPAPGTPQENLSNREVLAMQPDGDHSFIAGSAGLYSIDVRTMTYRKLANRQMDGQIINALLLDGNSIWAANDNGLRLYNRSTGEVRTFNHQLDDASSLSDDAVRDIVKTRDGSIWVTTRLGLDLYDPAKGAFQHIRRNAADPHSLPSDNLQPLTEDAQGRLWIGTVGSGLTILENPSQPASPRFLTINHTNGLPSDIVLTLTRGKDGKMWVKTMAGLTQVDPTTLHATTYTEADGLPNSAQKLYSSALLDDGTILFPASTSLVLVRPEQLHPWTYQAPLALAILSQPGDDTSQVLLARQAMLGQLSLSSHKGFHTNFALLDYTAPTSTHYSYQLDSFDTGWNDVTEIEQGATYTNLPPGDYHFKVRAVSRSGHGPESTLDVPIRVTARFYETGAFRAFCVIAVLIGVLVFVRIRIALMVKRHSELEHEIAQRTSELKVNEKELLQLNDRLARLALHDTLTGLLNRRGFYERAEMETIRSQRSGKPFSLMLVDLDNFKNINDTMGHVAGDECICAVSDTLTLNLRPTDIVARYGGEEMILMLPETNEEIALQLAERLRHAVASLKILHNGHTISMTISIGLTSSYQSSDLDQLIVIVDKALYAAKHDGKNCVRAAY